MNFSFQKGQIVYVSSCDLFATGKKTIPGVTVYSDEEMALRHSVQRKGMITGKQWYTAEIPARDTFLYRTKPAAEQPFPVLHSLFSQKSLSLLFAGELAVFKWQLSCYLKDKGQEEAESLSAEETAIFFNEKRSTLLSLVTGEALIKLVTEKATRKEPEILPAYFSALGISGILDEADGNTVFLIFNPRVSLKILSVHRESSAYPAIPSLRSMK